jgi:hypothetical protein
VPIAIVGTALMTGAVWSGAMRRINGWPFACYPTFSAPPPARIPLLSVAASFRGSPDREVKNFGIPSHLLYGLSRNILATDGVFRRDGLLLLLWKQAVATAPELRAATEVRFCLESRPIDPDRWSEVSTRGAPLFVWTPPPGGVVPDPGGDPIATDVEWQ